MILDDMSDYYWMYCEDENAICSMNHSESGGAGVLFGLPDLGSRENRANGRLIAYAPDMFRFLRELRVELWDFIATSENVQFNKQFLDCVDNLDKFIKTVDPEDEV